MELYNEIEFYAKVNSKVRVGGRVRSGWKGCPGKLEIHSEPQTLRMKLSIWQDSQDKRSGRSITCFVRKWKEKVAWPRLTKEDIKVGSGLLFVLCSLCTQVPKLGLGITLDSFPTNTQSCTRSCLFDFLNILESITSSLPNSGLIHH